MTVIINSLIRIEGGPPDLILDGFSKPNETIPNLWVWENDSVVGDDQKKLTALLRKLQAVDKEIRTFHGFDTRVVVFIEICAAPIRLTDEFLSQLVVNRAEVEVFCHAE